MTLSTRTMCQYLLPVPNACFRQISLCGPTTPAQMHALPVSTSSLALHVSVICSAIQAASRLALHKPSCISFHINTYDRCRCSGEGVAFRCIHFLRSRTTGSPVTAPTQQPVRLLLLLQHARLFHHFLFAAPAPARRLQGNAASYSCPQKRALHQIPMRAVS